MSMCVRRVPYRVAVDEGCDDGGERQRQFVRHLPRRVRHESLQHPRPCAARGGGEVKSFASVGECSSVEVSAYLAKVEQDLPPVCVRVCMRVGGVQLCVRACAYLAPEWRGQRRGSLAASWRKMTQPPACVCVCVFVCVVGG